VARRTNLPTALTSFVGRDADVVKVREWLGDYRLTTLIGPGGAGKTRLAVEASRTLLDQMPDGVWLVELDRVTDPADLPAAVLAALGLREQSLMGGPGDPVDRLTAALRDRAALLVLDNCEHVITAAASLADRVLADCPRLRILATSREPLNINGESVWPVEPLALPAEDVKLGVAELMSYDAVRLLVDRVRAVRPGFSVTDDDVPAVSAICRALDGIPLAIELAAARLRTMTVVQLASRLDDRFRLLTGGNRTAMTRHQTLRAVVDWSWELLSEAERALLRRVTVFAGGVTVEAAERVCAGRPVQTSEVLDLLTALADKSLLMAEGDDEAPRYRMLETIRAYGSERLDEAGERDAMRNAYARFFVELAETAEPHLRRAEQLEWGRRLEAEHDNLHAAMRSAVALGDAQLAVRMVNAAGWYWWFSGHKAEGIQLATEALEVPGEVDAATRATGAAMIAYFTTAGLGDLGQAEPWIREAQRLTKELADPGPLLRLAVAVFTGVQDEWGRGTSAMKAMEPLLADDDPWVRAQSRLTRTRMLGDEERESDIEKALDEFRSIGERWGISFALATLGDLAARRGDLPLAVDYCRQAAQVLTEMGAREDLVFLRAKEAQLHWLLGNPARAAAAMVQAERDAEHVAWADAHAALAFFKGDLARWSGDLGTARTELGRVDAVLQDVKADPLFRSMILDSLAYVDASEGDLARAGDRRAEALAIALGGGDLALVSQILVGVADQAVRRGYPHEAARLLAAAEGVGGGPDRSRPDEPRVAAAARAAVGDAKFTEALKRARDGFSGLGRDELANSEEVRELTMSVLSAPAPKAG
jgi:predicted ATPase